MTGTAFTGGGGVQAAAGGDLTGTYPNPTVPALAPLQALSLVQAAQIAAEQRADAGYCVGQGCVLGVSGTAGKLSITAGSALVGTTDLSVAAATAITGTDSSHDDITELADATNPKWVAVELDASGITYNQGTAAAVPAIPAFTATRVPLGLLFIPAAATNSTTIDSLLTTSNGNVKLVPIGVTRPGPTASGWQYDQNTWVYASASTFTIAGVDATGYLKPGTKISWNDGSVKYGVVLSSTFSTNTTVTIAVNNDYVIANATIIRPRYSMQLNPLGYPDWFAYTPAITGYSGNPSGVYKYKINGRTVTVHWREAADGTSNATTKTYTAPVAASSALANTLGIASIKNNAAVVGPMGSCAIPASSNIISVFLDAVFGGVTLWTASAAARVLMAHLEYEF